MKSIGVGLCALAVIFGLCWLISLISTKVLGIAIISAATLFVAWILGDFIRDVIL